MREFVRDDILLGVRFHDLKVPKNPNPSLALSARDVACSQRFPSELQVQLCELLHNRQDGWMDEFARAQHSSPFTEIGTCSWSSPSSQHHFPPPSINHLLHDAPSSPVEPTSPSLSRIAISRLIMSFTVSEDHHACGRRRKLVNLSREIALALRFATATRSDAHSVNRSVGRSCVRAC